MKRRHALPVIGAVLSACGSVPRSSAQTEARAATSLQDTYRHLLPELSHSDTSMPLRIASEESSSALSGHVLARLDAPFAKVRAAMLRPETWCEILILHLNTKQCTLLPRAEPVIRMAIARKHDMTLDQAQSLDLNWHVVHADPAELSIVLTADAGPLGTRDYRVSFQAISLDRQSSVVAFGYSCRIGTAARIGMQAYLSTFGGSKVGFSRSADGRSLIGGMRGVVERTAMRYFLGVNAWLDTRDIAEPLRRRNRFERWFELTEQFPRQLHEVDRATYLAYKLRP